MPVAYFGFFVNALSLALSGRRALIAIALLFVGYWMFKTFSSKLRSHLSLIIASVLLVLFAIGGVFGFLSAFSFSELDVSIRTEQISALFFAAFDNPIMGIGPGGSVPLSYRESFGFEMWFFYQLAAFGCLFSFLIAVIFIRVIAFVNTKNSRSSGLVGEYRYALMQGFASLCLASVTNPYFANFDLLWILFLPFLLARTIVREQTS